jgi:DNA replication protein DnaC
MMTEAISEKCRALRLNTCMRQLSAVVEMAAQKNWPAVKTIEHLLDLELEARRQTQMLLRFKQSKLCETPTIDQFDFNFHSSRKNQKGKILQLLIFEFLAEKKDIILIGNPGVGKSLLAKIVAYAATQQGFKVLFTTAMDMINHLVAAEADHSLLKKLHHYGSPQLLSHSQNMMAADDRPLARVFLGSFFIVKPESLYKVFADWLKSDDTTPCQKTQIRLAQGYGFGFCVLGGYENRG